MSRNFNMTGSGDFKILPKKKILFIITQSEYGGAQKFAEQLIGKINSNKFEFHLATGIDGDGSLSKTVANVASTHTIRHLKRNVSFVSDLKVIFEIRNIIKSLRPDILFLASSKAGFVGSLSSVFPSRLKNVKVIYRIGGWTFNDPWPKWKKWIFRKLEQISAGWKDYIVVNNLSDYNQAKELNIDPRKDLILIHNGIDPYMDILEKEDAYQKLLGHSKNKKLTVGIIANFYPTKGLEYLVKAVNLIKKTKYREKIQFVIIGDGTERKKLEDQISNLGLSNMVILVGRVAKAYRYLKAFDIYVMPSVKEGMSWAVLEAMSAKIPVIATSAGAIPEIIQNQKNGIIIPPSNPQALMKAILELIVDESKREQIAINGHQTVILKFRLEGMLNKFEKLLK